MTDRCPEKLKPGGCQLHNLHCDYPKCNEPSEGEQVVDKAIVSVVLKQAYQLIDELMDTASPNKELKNRVGKLLPDGYKHSYTKAKP